MPKEKVYKASNNIFADIGVKHPERVLARSQIMFRITEIIQEQGLTQKEAAQILGIPQSKVSQLMNGKLSSFSLDLLFQLLNALDRDVRITISPKKPRARLATTKVVSQIR